MLGYALLLGAWSMATAPFASPDEVGHYVRAAGVGQGELVGAAVTVPRTGAQRGVTSAQRAWLARNTRGARVPSRLVPLDIACLPGTRRGSGCTVATWVGTYPPLGYLAPGLAERAATTPVSADRLGRLASGFVVLLLLAWATLLAWQRGGATALAGVAAAVTPMVLFVGAMLNPSGLEIAAAVLFATATVCVAAPCAPRSAWTAFAIAGVLLAVTRSLGPIFIAADLLAVVALVGPRGAMAAVRRRPGSATAAAGVLAPALLVGRLWEHRHGAAPDLGFAPVGASLSHGAEALPDVLRQAVGDFGALTVPLPLPAVLAWLAIVALPVGLALSVGLPRERLVVLSAVGVNLAFPIVLYAAVVRHTGWDVQGRYVLPLLVIVPVLAAEICRRHDATMLLRHAGTIVAAAGVLHLAAWATAMGQTDSVPPLGWGPWTACATTGALAFLVAANRLRRDTVLSSTGARRRIATARVAIASERSR